MDYLFEVTENYVWNELSTAYCYARKIRAYIDRSRKFNRWSNWIIISVSVIASVSYWSNTEVGAILSAVAAVALVLKELLPIFNQPESELIDLYNKYILL